MKKFNRNMLAHLNAANKQGKMTVEQKESKLSHRNRVELEKFGVLL